MNTEVKVGLLFFIGLGMVGYFTVMTTSLGRPKGTLSVNFPRIARLKEGDIVTYNGVKVGLVTEVKPVLDGGNPAVQVSFSVQSDLSSTVLVGEKSHFSIDQRVLGGASLQIISEGGKPISPDALAGVRGETPTSLSDVLTMIQEVIGENRQNLKGAIANAKEALDKFGKASGEIEQLVKENRTEIKQAITNFKDTGDRITKLVDENREGVKAAVERVEQASREIRDAVAENRPNLKKAIDKAPEAVENVSGAGKEIKEAVAENRPDLRSAIKDLKDTTPKIEKTADNLQVITDQVASGKGTVGKLVFEDTLHDKATTTLDNINQRVEEVKPVTQGFSELKFVLGVEGGTDVRTGSSEGDVYLRVEPRPYKFYEAGIVYRTAPRNTDTKRDDPDKLSVDFNLVLGWRWFPDDDAQLYRLTTAAGLISTQPGLYVATAITKNFGLYSIVRRKDNTRDENDRRYEEGAMMVRACAYYSPVSWLHLQAGGNDLASSHPGAWFALRVDVLDNDLRNLTSVSSLVR